MAPRPWGTSPCHSSTAPLALLEKVPASCGLTPPRGHQAPKPAWGVPPLLIYYTPPCSASHCRLAARENQDPPLSMSYLPFPPPMESATKPLSHSLTPLTSLLLFPSDSPLPVLSLPIPSTSHPLSCCTGDREAEKGTDRPMGVAPEPDIRMRMTGGSRIFSPPKVPQTTQVQSVQN